MSEFILESRAKRKIVIGLETNKAQHSATMKGRDDQITSCYMRYMLRRILTSEWRNELVSS